MDSHEHGVYYVNHLTKMAQFNHPCAPALPSQQPFQYENTDDNNTNDANISGATNTGSAETPDAKQTALTAHRRVPSLLSPNQNNEGTVYHC